VNFEQTATIDTSSPGETRAAGEALGAAALPDDVVALSGDLGAGKTVLAQGIAAGLGVAGHVPSPTFNLLLVHRGRLTMYHFDLYRLDEPGQLVDIDFHGTVEAGGLAVIEWSDRFPAQLPVDRLDVALERTPDEGRRLRASATGPRSVALLQRWLDARRERATGGRP
jgi:tRNA threonylcarbamoyladenosine biosynthesis protein TsaE